MRIGAIPRPRTEETTTVSYDDRDSDSIHVSKGGWCGIGCLGLVVALVLFVIAAPLIFGPVIDWMWYRSVGYAGVFTTQIGLRASLFFGTFAAVGAASVLSLVVASKLAPQGGPAYKRDDEAAAQTRPARDYYSGSRSYVSDDTQDTQNLIASRWTKWAIIGVIVALALGAGFVAQFSWQTVALWQHQVPFVIDGKPVVDPNYGQDLGFYFFGLPMINFAAAWIGGLLDIAFIAAAAWYALMIWGTDGKAKPRAAMTHLALIAAARVGLWAYCLAFVDKFNLSFMNNGWATGVSASDATILSWAYPLLALLMVATAVSFVVLALKVKPPLYFSIASVSAFGGLFLAVMLVTNLLPFAYWSVAVHPDPVSAEQQYIANNIAMTRLGYGIDGWTVQQYPATGPVTAADLTADAGTVGNMRLWDYRPLQQTLDQLQVVRQYYTFNDVDIDRYNLNGVETQVMLSPREIDPSKNPTGQNFLNTHVQYTHGYGVAMVPVNAETSDKLPVLIIKDMPVTSNGGAPTITQPQIYFGESTNDWVLVGAKSPEFDAPATTSTGATDTTTRWTGGSGIGMDSLPMRLMFALTYHDPSILLTDQVVAGTSILINRDINGRLAKLAPFLSWDSDPYLVVTPEGKLVWVADGYTTSDQMPDAKTFDNSKLPSGSGLKDVSFNYIRNSVKAVVDAYTGAATFYINDASDPLVNAWAGVYPGLLHPFSEMPASISAHLRYPEDLFDAQTNIFGSYHVTDPGSFYQSSDLWTVPQASSSDSADSQALPTEAYYTEMRLPGETAPEYMLMQPMTLNGRQNMIAWVGARNDGADRGKVVVYKLPTTETIYGPTQIESMIKQDKDISSAITLWDQSGSKVVLGNLLVMPVGQTFMYVQPLYIQASGSPFPQLTKVIVATSQKVGWGDTLAAALADLLASPVVAPGGGTTPTPTPAATPTPPPAVTFPPDTSLPADIKGLIAYADQHYQAAQAQLRAGSLTGYDTEMAKVGLALDALARLEGIGASPSPSASAAPSPKP